MLEIISMEIDCEMPNEVFAELLSKVSPEKRERVGRFAHRRGAVNTLMGEIMARYMVCARTGLQNNELKFAVGEYGKPYLLNDLDIQFNISHSGDIIVCAVSAEPVGIDVELIKPINLKLAERFFHADENAYILAQADKEEAFFEIWTKKESYIKREGTSIPLNSFNVLRNPDRFISIDVLPGASCHVCVENESVGSHVRYRLSELLPEAEGGFSIAGTTI